MIAILIIWVYIFMICLLSGIGIIALFERFKWFNVKLSKNIPIDYIILVGFVFITTFLGYFSLFYKIGALANAILWVFCLAILYFNFTRIKELAVKNLQVFKTNWFPWILIIIIILIAVIPYSLSTIKAYDTGLYHAQSIQWIEKFGIVPGLGNLHGRFAFNSHFFLPSALFNLAGINSVVGIQATYYPVNSFFYVLLVSRLLFTIRKAYKESHLFMLVFCGALLYFSYTTFAFLIQSPTPDVIIGILIIYLFLIYFNREKVESISFLLIALIALLLPTFKLSTIFMSLLPLALLVNFPKKQIWVFLSAGAFIILPFVLRNIILSGYFVYPFPHLDIINVDWKIPLEKVISESNKVKSWARIPGNPPDVVLALSLKEWFPYWMKQRANFLIYLNAAFPVLMIVYYFIFKKIGKKQLIASVVLILNLLLWFFMAPDPRFVYGVLAVVGSLSFALAFLKFKNRYVKYVLSCSLVILFFVATKSVWNVYLPVLSKNYLIPSQLSNVPTRQSGNEFFSYSLPRKGDDRCFNAPIPCTPNPNKNLSLRTGTLNGGFKIIPKPKKQPKSENPRSLYAKGESLMNEKKFNEAIDIFTKVIELNKSKVTESYFYRGVAKYLLNDKVDGCSDIEKAINLSFQPAIDFSKKYCD